MTFFKALLVATASVIASFAAFCVLGAAWFGLMLLLNLWLGTAVALILSTAVVLIALKAVTTYIQEMDYDS